jgi:hypothetical protein
MCRHLTDFASTRKPTIKTASLSDMTALSPGDLVTKLKFLFITVMLLFGGMCIGAFIGTILDYNERKSLLYRMQQPDVGFRVGPGGSWLWRLEQDPLGAELAKPHGTAVQLSAVFGMPYMRLRLALPEEMLPGPLADALGRRAGLSPSNFKANLHEEDAAMTRIAAGLKKSFGFKPRAGRIPRTSSTVADDNADPVLQKLKSMEDGKSDDLPEHLKRLETRDAVGTALAMAFMTVCTVLPAPELAAARAKASHVLRNVPTGSDRLDFDGLFDHFCVMLTSGNLNTRSEWLKRARIWRLILTQAADGSWGPSANVSFALFACDPEELERAKKLPKRKYKFLGKIADLMDSDEELVESEDGEDAEFDEDFDQKAEDDEEGSKKPEKKLKPWEIRMRNRILPKAFQRWRGMAEASRNAYMSSRGFTLPPEAPKDCMLTTSASSLLLCMPRALRLIRAEEARRERQRELDKLQPRAKAPKPKPPPVLAAPAGAASPLHSDSGRPGRPGERGGGSGGREARRRPSRRRLGRGGEGGSGRRGGCVAPTLLPLPLPSRSGRRPRSGGGGGGGGSD